MTRFLDIRIGSSGQLDAVRRLEYIALLLLVAVVAYAYRPLGFLVAGPALLMAIMLVPGRPIAVSREDRRRAVLRVLQAEGLALRTEWRSLVELPLSDESSQQRAFFLRKALVWLTDCREQLRKFPELYGIFEAQAPAASVVEELDSCIGTLSRIRRLVSLSEKLDLPI